MGGLSGDGGGGEWDGGWGDGRWVKKPNELHSTQYCKNVAKIQNFPGRKYPI